MVYSEKCSILNRALFLKSALFRIGHYLNALFWLEHFKNNALFWIRHYFSSLFCIGNYFNALFNLQQLSIREGSQKKMLKCGLWPHLPMWRQIKPMHFGLICYFVGNLLHCSITGSDCSIWSYFDDKIMLFWSCYIMMYQIWTFIDSFLIFPLFHLTFFCYTVFP